MMRVHYKIYNDYYPFGMEMVGRLGSIEEYRYGFQGQEKDDEIFSSSGTIYTAEFWQYDCRIGRRWNIDPVVKPHESSYSTFANNPVCFIDPLGNDTSFVNSNGDYDKQAKKDFTTAYDNVNNRIFSLNEEIKGYEKQLASGELNKRQTNKINKAKTKAENTLRKWNKLSKDFENIINSPVVFIYSSDISGIKSGFEGETGSPDDVLYTDTDGNIIGGRVSIFIKGGRDELVIHENRHGNQRLERENKSKLERETEAFIYQRIYDHQSVQDFIDKITEIKYGYQDESIRQQADLEEAIKYKYNIK